MSTCNRLDLQTLGYRLVMPKNLPEHWYVGPIVHYFNSTCNFGCLIGLKIVVFGYFLMHV